jgi:diguanylate cyclase (GGDEF)-like protein
MLSPIATSLSIVFVSLFFGTALLVAWRRFGVQFHAAFWALSFMFSAAGHGVRVFGVVWPDYQSTMAMLACQASIGSFALLAIGFRSRANLDHRLISLIWALSAVAILVFWSAQPFEWRMASRMMTSAADALFVGIIVFLPRNPKGLSSPVRLALAFFGLYILSVGIAAWMARPDGEIAEASFIIVLSLGTPTGMMATGILTLFILAADLAGELQKQAQYDYLSDLLNRRGFEERLASQRLASNETGFIVATDLDRFKSINDRLGHAAVDEVIRRFARHLQDAAGNHDLTGRMGGEEFALFIASGDGREALERVERLRMGVSSLYPDIDVENPVTASFGVVRLKPEESFHQAYARADAALYASKDAGRNTTVADLDEAA